MVHSLGTSPIDFDTDGNGVSEVEEDFDNDNLDEYLVNTYLLVSDSDDDNLIDGDEIREQTFIHQVKDENCAIEEVRVSMKVRGNINKTTSVESVMNKDMLCTGVVGLVGEPFATETESDFDKVTISFKFNQSKSEDTPFNDLLFLWHDEKTVSSLNLRLFTTVMIVL